MLETRSRLHVTPRSAKKALQFALMMRAIPIRFREAVPSCYSDFVALSAGGAFGSAASSAVSALRILGIGARACASVCERWVKDMIRFSSIGVDCPINIGLNHSRTGRIPPIPTLASNLTGY